MQQRKKMKCWEPFNIQILQQQNLLIDAQKSMNPVHYTPWPMQHDDM